MALRIALVDAANNCSRENAKAVLTLKSGIQYMGDLEQIGRVGDGSAHLKLAHGGWVSIEIEEIAAVESKR